MVLGALKPPHAVTAGGPALAGVGAMVNVIGVEVAVPDGLEGVTVSHDGTDAGVKVKGVPPPRAEEVNETDCAGPTVYTPADLVQVTVIGLGDTTRPEVVAFCAILTVMVTSAVALVPCLNWKVSGPAGYVPLAQPGAVVTIVMV